MRQRHVVVVGERKIGDQRAQARQHPGPRWDGGKAVPDIVERDAAQFVESSQIEKATADRPITGQKNRLSFIVLLFIARRNKLDHARSHRSPSQHCAIQPLLFNRLRSLRRVAAN